MLETPLRTLWADSIHIHACARDLSKLVWTPRKNVSEFPQASPEGAAKILHRIADLLFLFVDPASDFEALAMRIGTSHAPRSACLAGARRLRAPGCSELVAVAAACARCSVVVRERDVQRDHARAEAGAACSACPRHALRKGRRRCTFEPRFVASSAAFFGGRAA